jgi:hypothetical protein
MTGIPPFLVNILAAATMAGACWFFFSLLLAMLYRSARGPIAGLPPVARHWLLLGLGAMPLTASLAATLCVMLPDGLLLHPHCHAAVGCGTHTPVLGRADHFYLWLPALLAGITALLWVVRGCATFRACRRASALLRGLAAGRDRRGFRVIDSPRPLAVCAGWWQGDVLLSSGLLAALDSADLEVILAHERTHARRRDNLTRLVLTLLFCPLSARPAALLLRDFTLATEQIADRAAARHSGEERVARTLLRAQRLGLRTLHPGFSSFTSTALEARIHALYASRGPVHRNTIATLLALLLVALATFALGVDGGHHAIEALFGASR